jgi:endonuclease/exonuclease/phosphatase family metal-dependent hydrolase
VVVLGDFNATTGGDRADLAALARAAGLVWATEPLACSAFWDRDDGCPSSRLDHVLTWAAPASVAAAGACATDGCAWHDRCPLYADEVSDHCPVVVSVPVPE